MVSNALSASVIQGTAPAVEQRTGDTGTPAEGSAAGAYYPQSRSNTTRGAKSSDNVAEMNKGFDEAFDGNSFLNDPNFSSNLSIDANKKMPFDFIQSDYPTTPSSVFSKHSTDHNASASFTANSVMDSVLDIDKAALAMNEMFISPTDPAAVIQHHMHCTCVHLFDLYLLYHITS